MPPRACRGASRGLDKNADISGDCKQIASRTLGVHRFWPYRAVHMHQDALSFEQLVPQAHSHYRAKSFYRYLCIASGIPP